MQTYYPQCQNLMPLQSILNFTLNKLYKDLYNLKLAQGNVCQDEERS